MTGERDTVLIGAGQHARVLLGVFQRPVIGAISTKPPSEDLAVWLGDDAKLRDLDPQSVVLINAIGGTRNTIARRKVFDLCKSLEFEFRALCHASAVLDTTVDMGEGVHIMAGAVVQSGVRLEANTLVNSGAIVDHDCVIGAHSHVAPGATLSGGVCVGAGVHIGVGSVIVQGVRIGDMAVVGAGAVVIEDVPTGATVVGNPARVLSK